MIGPLTIKQREYILYHLGLFFEMPSELKDKFSFGIPQEGKICFTVNTEAYDHSKVLWIKDLPILFPGDDKKNIYEFQSGTLIFKHDLMKSAFYLLSGFREFNSTAKDELGRFPHEVSVQYELGIIDRPIVNEYFEIMFEAISKYCEYHDIPFKRKNNFEKASLFLTHDVDRIDKYSFHTVKGALKKETLREGDNLVAQMVESLLHEKPQVDF